MAKFTDYVKSFGVKQVLGYLDKDPEANIPKIIDWLEKNTPKDGIAKHMPAARKVLDNKDGNWYKLIMKFYTDVDVDVRKKLFENFIIHTAMLGLAREEECRQKYQCNIPWAILIDPTSACNLKCVGCWAAEYDKTTSLTFEELDSIITQGKELGTYMYLFSGGEPLMRKKDIVRLAEKHNDCIFSPFTNGTLIDEEFAQDILRVKNIVPGISVEGNEETTDARRGKGTYKKIMRAMDILKKHHIPYGASCCYTSANTEVIGSEEYMDFLIDLGCYFEWLFTYMPVGKDAAPELVASAEQRKFMYEKIRGYRKTKAIWTMDFWNDGEFVNGCIAGGRRYLHINSNGDIEPCAFIHYSDSNIREKTLLEAYQSPLFMSYRKHHPFNENHLRVCPMFDNPGALDQMVDESHAPSTEMINPEDVHELMAKTKGPAERWAPVADELWIKSGHTLCNGCSSCNKEN